MAASRTIDCRMFDCVIAFGLSAANPWLGGERLVRQLTQARRIVLIGAERLVGTYLRVIAAGRGGVMSRSRRPFLLLG
jgi:hypothetical protein